MSYFRNVLLLLCAAAGLSNSSAEAIEYAGQEMPGAAEVHIRAERVSLENKVLGLTFETVGNRLKFVELIDKVSGSHVGNRGSEFFAITYDDAGEICCSQMDIKGGVAAEMIKADAGRGGVAVKATFISANGELEADWRIVLWDESNYVRQFVTVRPLNREMVLKSLAFNRFFHPSACVVGTVDGSVVVAENMFFAYEHPNAANHIYELVDQSGTKRVVCRLERNTTLKAGQSLAQSAVIGVAPQGQLRRGFLYYIERERVRSYRPFLHYNSWYDIAWGEREKMKESECLEVIENLGKELIEKRAVKLDSFVFDDGWDDPATLWQILKPNFPNGFTPLMTRAAEYGTRIGVWLSPWGGYGQARQQRLQYGKAQGFETDRSGFSLAGPMYYARFRQSCLDMMDKYKVNFFKFDGTDASLLEQTEALFRLNRELYAADPELFISITTGTWASPFWLLYGDCIWRGGDDMGLYGRGSPRERWITYRDMNTFRNVVQKGPLYPLNSLMYHGVVNGQWGMSRDMASFGQDFEHEVHSFFGTGTNLQELYIAFGRMSQQAWDVLAEAAKWARANADVLVDAHWVGADPGKLQIYGCAAWSSRKGTLMLRNPDDKAAEISVDIGRVFELPAGAPRKYLLKSPWQQDGDKPGIILEAGSEHIFELGPFDVLVFDARAVAG